MTRLPGNLLAERAGVLAVAAELNRLGVIWRETPMADVGIDGQIEFVDDAGQTIGRLAGAQIKSGESWFHDGGDVWRFYAEEKHRRYWERLPLPVLIFLHSPTEGTFWTDGRLALRSPEREARKFIAIPKSNRLQSATRDAFFSSVGASGRPFLAVDELLPALASRRSPSASLPLSYLDLFANGLTDIGRSVYYGMDLVMEVAEALLESDGHLVLGPREHDFLFGFIQFLVEQQIADVDISNCLVQWNDAGMHPTFIAPLTARGRMLLGLISEWQSRLVSDGRLRLPEQVSVAQETFVRMEFTAVDYLRMPLIREFGRLIAPVAKWPDS
ncbi:DUF4365 domain-containing protein [Longimicrobium terrae]|uniref:DUF4365 domain-containing protein n=1 Tax=Longimicrobium terrae TaxID=1639882 RepID=A0A841GK25_9BACT|nr:DUF4365 domain-containing protein [Longimicrobium terrae]MBB4634173.1 hypothetical protein [Longimicrobium terrae]MBB6068937.1 hypothetical protein [Longimicrobium terrae]NNC28117.1 DUF4365 domain-containing protein [Longimicrobium terrae]